MFSVFEKEKRLLQVFNERRVAEALNREGKFYYDGVYVFNSKTERLNPFAL